MRRKMDPYSAEASCDGRRSAAAHYLGNIGPGHGIVAGIFTLRRENHVNARLIGGARNLQSTRVSCLKQRNHHLFRRTRIGRAFQHDQLALMNVRSNGLTVPTTKLRSGS